MIATYDYPVAVVGGARTPVRGLWSAGLSGLAQCVAAVADREVCRRPSAYVVAFVDGGVSGVCAEHAAYARRKYDLVRIETYVPAVTA